MSTYVWNGLSYASLVFFINSNTRCGFEILKSFIVTRYFIWNGKKE
ncbi:hypothetical protein BD809_103329 [Aquimarina intermedia]|uniref:Uncharacterized protein n=1 Tax=Aquimarina intermedia TaxID=350814 RepID=A0A5S5C778_9FLAO|nr:hypothetical protein BD809_103329 [Aquimarina intermedia]